MIRVVTATAAMFALVLTSRASFADDPAPTPVPAPPPVAAPPAETPPAPPAPVPARDDLSPIPRRSRDIKIEIPGERSRNNKILVGSLAAAGLIGSALGLYWHLDSRDASDAVSADEFTGKAWTEEQIGLVDRADRSRTRAIVAYSIGGALLVGAIATYIATSPKSETTVIHTGVAVTPVEHGSGGMVTKLWSF